MPRRWRGAWRPPARSPRGAPWSWWPAHGRSCAGCRPLRQVRASRFPWWQVASCPTCPARVPAACRSSRTWPARSSGAGMRTRASWTAPAPSSCAAAPSTCFPAIWCIRCGWTSSATSWTRYAASCPPRDRPSPRSRRWTCTRSWSSPARPRRWPARARSWRALRSRTPPCATCWRSWRAACASTAPTCCFPTCTTRPRRSGTTRAPRRSRRWSSRALSSTTRRTPTTT